MDESGLDEQGIRTAYRAYSAQDLDGLLSFVADDVDWSDGRGGRLHGHPEVEAFWREQWTRTRTVDEPVEIAELAGGVRVVRLDQVVRSVDGDVLSSGHVLHVLQTEAGVIRRLDIVPLID